MICLSLTTLKLLTIFYYNKRQKLKIYNDVYGRLYGCHTTKTAKIKKKVILLCNTSPECQSTYTYWLPKFILLSWSVVSYGWKQCEWAILKAKLAMRMRGVTWPDGVGSSETTYFESATPICLSTIQLLWGYNDD